MSSAKLNLLDLSQPSIRILHLSWFAFFLTFMIWFNLAPLKPLIMAAFAMTEAQWKARSNMNIALTIPARMVIAILVDKFGPRAIFSGLLITSGLLCLAFASAQTYEELALTRFLLGFVGASFVIGIRLVGEWFPARQVGLAEGIYGGWGNFGSAAAAFTLPTIALLFGGDNGWRYAIAITGILSLGFGFIYYFNVSNTPKGSTYFKPKNHTAMEVTSKGDFFLLLVMKIPMYAALALLAWKLSPDGVKMLSASITLYIYWGLFFLYLYEAYHVWMVNKHVFKSPVPEMHRYKFKQVAVLDILYFTNFGSELAVVSMLPLFFLETFSLSPVVAGMLASGYAFMNLM